MAERARCELCNLEFKDADGLAQHQKAKHAEHQSFAHHHSHLRNHSQTSAPITYSGKKTYLLIAGVFLVILLFWFFKSSPNGGVIVNMTEVIGSGRPTLGDSDARVTIVEFSDFQCPYCAAFAQQTYPLIKRDYVDTGKAKIIFRNFPIYQAHPQAMQAAEAALCVYKDGKNAAFFKYHDKLFQNYEDLSLENLNAWALDLGTNISTCLNSHVARNDILNDMEDARKAGVKGTPAFFINGKLVEGNLPYGEFKKIIDEFL